MPSSQKLASSPNATTPRHWRAFLRNSNGGVLANERESHLFRSAVELVKDALLVLLLVVIFAGINVGHAEAERVVEEHRELTSRGRNLAFAFPRTCAEPAVEGTQARYAFCQRSSPPCGTRRLRGWTHLGVLELSTRPPEILFPGARESHDVKCLTLGHFRMSSPHSPMRRSTGVGAEPVDLAKVGAEQRVQCGPKFELRFVPVARVPNRRKRSGRGVAVVVQFGQRHLDLDITLVHLGAVEVVEFERLTKCEHVFGAVVAVEGLADGLDLDALQRSSRCLTSTLGSRIPSRIERMIFIPVAPVMSLTT